jgi:hypothetical protein
MLVASVDTSGMSARLDNMLDQLKAMPPKMAEELTTWQRDDMRRQVPNTETPDETTVATNIWPRGRTVFLLVRPSPHPSVPYTGPRSTRPILRPALYDMMHTRMTALLESIRW